MKGRYGIIKVSNDLVRDHIEIVSEIFAKMKAVVFRCEFLYAQNIWEYTMYSPLFEEIPEGWLTPLYTVIVTEIRDIETEEVIDHDVMCTSNRGFHYYSDNSFIFKR